MLCIVFYSVAINVLYKLFLLSSGFFLFSCSHLQLTSISDQEFGVVSVVMVLAEFGCEISEDI